MYKNVYTSLEIERLMNASGPTGGEIVLRDGTTPEMVGIVHCVGSRDENTNRCCSRVCCMYSLKLAHLIQGATGAAVYNFYIDMRTPGKGYEEFYDRVAEEGVQLHPRARWRSVRLARGSVGERQADHPARKTHCRA